MPEKLRTGEVRRFIRKGAEFLAAHRLYKSNHHGFQPIRGDWLDLHLPFGLDWRTDVLDLLNVATLVGLHDDPCVVDALRFVISKQDGRGRWRLEHRYKTGRDILAARVWNEETVGRPSKWITLAAVTQLKRCQNLVTRICAGERLQHGRDDHDHGTQIMLSHCVLPYASSLCHSDRAHGTPAKCSSPQLKDLADDSFPV